MVVGVVYVLLYLVGIGDLWITGSPGAFTARIAANPLHMFAVDGLGQFGAIGIVYLGGLGITYLVSPLNFLVAVLIGVLTGANASLTYLNIRQSRPLRRKVSSFLLAGVPALLMAVACIGPTVAFLTGGQNSSVLLVVVRLLVPISAVLVAASILRLKRQVIGRSA